MFWRLCRWLFRRSDVSPSWLRSQRRAETTRGVDLPYWKLPKERQ